jgi:hypothetical protein
MGEIYVTAMMIEEDKQDIRRLYETRKNIWSF